ELLAAQERLTAQAIAETFTAAAVVVAIGLAITFAMRRPLGEITMTNIPDDDTAEELPAGAATAGNLTDGATGRKHEPTGQRYTPDVLITSALAGEVPVGDPTADVPAMTNAADAANDDASDAESLDDNTRDGLDGDGLDGDGLDGDGLDGGVLIGGVPVVDGGALLTLRRRVNVMIGLLGLLLVAAFATIALLFGRVADAQGDASAARDELAATQTALDTARTDLERVEAGAALYASQITGFQEKLVELEPEISAGVEEAIAGLREFSESTISFNVPINETIPVQTEVVIKRTVQVPIKTSIPIKETFDTTIEVETALGFSIPLDVTVPVDIEVPIDLVVDIPIDETVPIDDEFSVDLDLPIAIDVGETELANLSESLAAGLESLQDMLAGFSG
ncbi:MAG TPA: hypothetical protein VMM60_12330, partial [Ilumatobacter sp.]|nr:hypothetical protein [Ilumatobacter sp.]